MEAMKEAIGNKHIHVNVYLCLIELLTNIMANCEISEQDLKAFESKTYNLVDVALMQNTPNGL